MNPQQFLTLLRCPSCRDEGDLRPQKKIPGLLKCARCGETVPIKDGIPGFVDNSDPGFDERWRTNPKIQATTAGVFQEKTGLLPEDVSGRIVLDAGCGCGRFSAAAASFGGDVVGVDLSESGLSAARANAPGVSLIRASLLDLPLKTASVDLAFSLGVLHHTPDPAAAFAEVARTVKRGGTLAIWVYVRPLLDARLEPLAKMIHALTTAIAPARLNEIFQEHAVSVRDAYREIGRWDDVQRIFQVSMSSDDAECVSDTLDWHAPAFRSWHSEDEVRGWFEAADFDVDRVGRFPVCVRGVKR